MAATTAEDPPDFGGEDEEVDQTPPAANAEASLANAADAVLASLADVSGSANKVAAALAPAPVSAAAAPAPPPLAGVPPAVPAAAPVLPPAPIGPQVVLPPTSASGGALGPPEEEDLPMDNDGEAWLELLRDGFAHQLREENECEEPPPFHRAMQFAADHPIPAGKFPRTSLNLQLQLLLRLRAGGMEAAIQKGVGKGPKGPPGVVPPITRMKQGGNVSMTPQQQAHQAQMLLAAAKQLQNAAAKAGTGSVVPPKHQGYVNIPGVQRTIGK